MASIKKKRSKTKPDFYKSIIDDFNPDQHVCEIIKTSPNQRRDNFTTFRPAPATCADYNISQTEMKFDAGDTKIHIQQTQATYEPLTDPPPPKPKKKKKNKYFSGGPAQWKMIDEIWRENQVALQKVYHKEFRIRVAKRKKEEKGKLRGSHEKAIAMVGPAWFQELSPKQMRTVDELKKCISKDYSKGTIINTQENIADLGLVLRPNQRHIAKALKECCKCPVEFLLILYQLINPTRTEYSLNDRILLSAVVHLTMRDTLRELHIRIPSPPRPPKTPIKPIKKTKKIEYESPYLVPYTFKREPRITGVYVNKHRQYPESPYFSYLTELRKLIKGSLPSTVDSVPIDEEIRNETIYAQSVYSQLVNFTPVPTLIAPSKYTPCYNIWNKRPESVSLFEDIHDLEVKPKESDSNEGTNCEKDEGTNVADLVYMVPDAKAVEDEPEVEVKEESTYTFTVETATCYKLEDYCAAPPVSNKTKPLCSRCMEDKEKENVGYIIGGYKQIDNDLIPIISGVYMKNSPSRLHALNILEKMKLTVNDESHKIDTTLLLKKESESLYPKYPLDAKPCFKCRDDVQRFLDLPPCQCEKCIMSRRLRKIQFTITGTKETEAGLMPVVGGVSIRKPCNCLEQYEKRIKKFEDYANKPCKCEDVIRFEMKKPMCLCDKCTKDREKRSIGYIISGLKETEDGIIPIIGGVYIKRPCKCLENYEKRIRDMIDYAKRMNAVRDLKKQKNRYIVGGVVQRPEGPIYLVQGLCPPVRCPCYERYKEEEKEQKRIANMPKLSQSRLTYGIGGVKETPDGNIFIITHTVASDDCECMKMYNEFHEQHKECLNLYESYLSCMKQDINEYMDDLLPGYEERRRSLGRDQSKSKSFELTDELVTNEESDHKFKPVELVQNENYKSQEHFTENINTLGLPSTEIPKPLEPIDCPQLNSTPPCHCGTDDKTETIICEPQVSSTRAVCKKSSSGSKSKSCCKKKPKRRKLKCGCCKSKPKRASVDCVDCTCGPPPEPEIEEIVEEEVVEEEEQQLKRFFIFNKIPCDERWHLEILKQALETMADDGYPLAKLPGCHKLPHFKLWMQMRCGKYWTLPDRYQFAMLSKTLWRHTDICYSRAPKADLNISKDNAKKLTWANANLCRKIAGDAVNTFYRKIRQQIVDRGREFFPTTFSYELPFKTFRDCYFAYTPAKEEEVLASYVWAPFEVKNFSKRKSCLC